VVQQKTSASVLSRLFPCFGMLACLVSHSVAIAALVGVSLLVAAMNVRSLLSDRSLEIATSAALMLNYLGVTKPISPSKTALRISEGCRPPAKRLSSVFQASSMVMTTALATGVKICPRARRVDHPVLPNRCVDLWQLINPSDAWLSVIAIAGIGFVNYVFLRIYSARGLYLGALFGRLVNSSATIAELGTRLQEAGMVNRITTFCLLTTVAMFARNLIFATIFSPGSLSATLLPLLAITLVAGLWIWREQEIKHELPGPVTLDSPISVPKGLWFGALFISIQIAGLCSLNTSSALACWPRVFVFSTDC